MVSTDWTSMNALRCGTEAEFRASFPNLSEAEKDELARQTGGHIPEPEKFFGRYGAYRQIHLARSRPRNGRRRATCL